MNEEQMEKLLRQGAVLKAPVGLLESLVAEIRLPRAEAARVEWRAPVPWFKRWLPALSFAVIFLGCLVALAMQFSVMSQLKGQNESLRASVQALETLRAENAEVERLSAENGELGRLRKDNAELQRLRDEVAQLAAQGQALETLRAENKRLAAEATSVSAAPDKDFFAEAKAKAERDHCANNLKQICLALRIWATDHNHIYPQDFLSMTNELNNWKILQCPSDTGRTVTSWADVAAGNVSYLFLTPGINELDDTDIVVTECPIHHTVGLADGSVQVMNAESYNTRLKMVNGRKVFVR